MSKELLNNLLKEYDQKKTRAELEAIERKDKLYELNPRLKEIESELNNLAINTAKSILNGNKEDLDDFNNKIKFLKHEKEELLKSKGIDLAYLNPYYDCKKCEDTGFITNLDGTKNMCNCLKQKLLNEAFNNSNISKIDKENFKTFNPLMYSDDVDLSKYKFNISPRKNILNIKEKSIEFINDFENTDSKNLLFTGNSGLRKNFYV